MKISQAATENREYAAYYCCEYLTLVLIAGGAAPAEAPVTFDPGPSAASAAPVWRSERKTKITTHVGWLKC